MGTTGKNFNLCIRRKKTGDSLVAIVRDDAGNILAASEFRYPFDASILTTIEDSVGKNIHRNAALIRRFGNDLFDAVFKRAVLTCYQLLRRAPLRIKLDLERNDVELLRIPWEFMFDGEHFLSARPGMSMTRVVKGIRRRKKKNITGRLKMLTVISSPLDLPEYYHPRVEAERQIIRQALPRTYAPDRMEMDFLEKASIVNIEKRLREEDCHVLHFTGHGIYSQKNRRCYLLLEDDLGTAERVDLDAFSVLLSRHSSLRLVMLSCCQTTIAVGHRVLGELPALLLEKGIPAAIAMQYSVTDRSAAHLEKEFHTGICNGLPIDRALSNARRALLASGNAGLVDFGTPVLYSDAPDCLRMIRQRPHSRKSSRPPAP
jgi:CHAT domain-containing protein